MVMLWWKCTDCKKLFVVPNGVEKKPKKCPKCGSTKLVTKEDYYGTNL